MKFKRLKEIRKKKKLKQQDIADILNVERSTYTGWENGKNTIPLKKLISLCNYYKVSLDFITGISQKNNYEKLSIDLKVISTNLKKFRKEKSLKQKEIYKRLKISSSSYSSYETGKILIPTYYIYTITKNYNYSIDKIFKKQQS